MMNEKEIRERVSRRLSCLDASPQRRMRIRAAIDAERQETPMKRTFSRTLLFATIAVMLMATIAIADRLNLFHFFGRQDERYAAVAPYAALDVTEPVLAEHPHLGKVTASIDSAYFDGLSLTLAYRIENARHVEAYTPSAEEIAAMQPDEPVTIALAGNEPGLEVYEAYNAAVENGTPYGYRKYTVYPSDHTVTDDGVDIPPYSAMEDHDETGAYCEVREFQTPLPAELRERERLDVSIRLYQQETIVWFDGKECYLLYDRSEIGAMNASIPLTKDAVHRLQGSGTINGVRCEATADVSQVAASIMVECGAPLNTFLQAVPEGTDPYDSWVEVVAADEQGALLLAQNGMRIDDRTAFTLPFLGTGTLPESITLYMYSRWEGMDSPELSTLDGIVLNMVE